MPEITSDDFGHCEGDTIIGKKKDKEAVVLTLLEKKTDNFIAVRIPSKTSAAVNEAMAQIKAYFGDMFSEVFKTITTDNGAEFDSFYEIKFYGTAVYYAHPHSS